MSASVAKTVTIIGAGVAGLAAGAALARVGWRVRVLERRPYVGGRASSYEHPGTAEVVDNCQHILLGCCTNLLHLLEGAGAADQLSWHTRFTYLEPGGRPSVLAPGLLPAPFHTAGAFLRMRALSAGDKLSIARGMRHFLLRTPPDTGESFAAWCVRTGQTRGAVSRFWRPVLVSALNDELENISLHYAGMVMRECFLRSPKAAHMGIPRVPLSELYGFVAEHIRSLGGQVRLRTPVERLEREGDEWCVHAGDGERFRSEAVVLAVSFEGVAKLLPSAPPAPEPVAAGALTHSPITSVHLWFDRPVTLLPHAVLLDSPFDWLYNVSQLQPWRATRDGFYLDLVVSASRAMVPMSREAVLASALGTLPNYLPAVREARLLRAAVTKEVRATFAVPPGVDALRPPQNAMPTPGIYLAGDWTRTGWPATMEGAARSGYLAAESVCAGGGQRQRFLVPDLPPSGLMRWL